MTGFEYQGPDTRSKKDLISSRGCLKSAENWTRIDLGAMLEGVLGLTGEAGEVSELVKKAIFHDKPLDFEHLKKELGDVLWYIALICDSMDTNIDKIMEMNVKKLKKRYPEGFDTYLSNHKTPDDL